MFLKDSKFLRQNSEPTHPSANSNKDVLETIDSHSLDGKRVHITFQVSNQGDDYFTRSFNDSFNISDVKVKLGEILNMESDNIDIIKEGNTIPDEVKVLELEGDKSPNANVEIVTKNDDFIDVEIVKEKFNDTISATLQKEPKRRPAPPIVTCKFNVVRQYHTFTKSFPSSTTINAVRDEISSIFMIEGRRLVMINKRVRLDEDVPLAELDMDNFGNIEIKLFTNDGSKLKLTLFYKDTAPVTDVLSVTVPKGENSFVNINVEVIDAKMIKLFLGGYRNKDTGIEYHHAFSQTPQRPDRVSYDKKNERDTQTVSLKTKAVDTHLARGTQMSFQGVYIPCVDDVIVTSKPYESYAQMVARIKPDHHATVIQRAWRAYRYRKAVFDWLRRCLQRIEDLKQEEIDDAKAAELRLRQEIVKKTFPRTREDFDQLYAMVDRWRNSEIARISKLHTKGPKCAEFCLLLDKEVEMLRAIEKFRAELKADNRIAKEKKLLETMATPVTWKSANGLHVSMDTLEAQHARYLKDLYYSFSKTEIKFEERMELLVNFKITLQEYQMPLAEQLKALIDRECDLMVRNVSNKDLEVLRKRIQAYVFKFIHLPEFNKGSMRRTEVKKHSNMQNERLFHCKECGQVKTNKDFPLHSCTTDMEICTSCTWGNSANNTCIEMMFYTYILRAIRREERRRRCWSSLAFVLQDNDIYYIVEKIWHSRSAISEVFDLNDLRLCRWRIDKDWAPWNCILLTTKEVKSHMMLKNPELCYDSDLVRLIEGKHLLARSHFSNLAGANDQEGDLYSLPTTQATSVTSSSKF